MNVVWMKSFFCALTCFLGDGNNEEVILRKNNVFLLLWDCLKYQRQEP